VSRLVWENLRLRLGRVAAGSIDDRERGFRLLIEKGSPGDSAAADLWIRKTTGVTCRKPGIEIPRRWCESPGFLERRGCGVAITRDQSSAAVRHRNGNRGSRRQPRLLRRFLSNDSPACWSLRPSSVSRQQVHGPAIRLLALCEDERKSGASWDVILRQTRYTWPSPCWAWSTV
jgi:hypothetical protein